MARTFKIIPKDWYKRRELKGGDIKPVHVTIPDYQKIHNHICNMVVTYSDKSTKVLIARVLFNELADRWTVDGMEVAVTVLEGFQEKFIDDRLTG